MTRFQFRLRTLLLALLLTSIVCAFLRTFWGTWPIAIALAWAALLMGMPLLLARPRVMLVTLPVVFTGLFYALWGEWHELALLAIPTGLLGMILLKLVLRGPIPRPATGHENDAPID